MKTIGFWRSIATRILGSLVGVSFVCIAVSVLSLYVQSGKSLRTNIEQRNLEIALQASREISRYISDSVNELASMGTILGPLPYEQWIRRTVLSNLSIEFKKFSWIAILDEKGDVLSDSRLEATTGTNLNAEVMHAILADTTIASPVRISADSTPFMIVSTPTRGMRGERGWLVAELQLRSIWDLVDKISIGGKEVGYLVSSSGVLIAHPDKTRVLAAKDSPSMPPPPKDIPETGTVRVVKEKGIDRSLTAYAKVDGVDWVMAVEQPVQEAFLPASLLFRQSLMLVLLGIGLSLVLGLLISRALSLPFMHLLEGTRTIQAGNLDYRIKIKGGDEIEKLAESFNAMVASLQTRTAELVESERKYRLMTERVNDIIFTLEEHGKITFLSPRLETIAGYVPTRYLGRRLIDYLPRHERKRSAALLEELLVSSGRMDRELQVEFAAKDGRKLLMEAHLTADVGPSGKRQIYGVARDVSERARLLEQLNQAQKMEAVGRLAGGVAHDFNNLLTAIIGYCDYSMLSLDEPETLGKNLEEIKKAGNRAAALTQQLLAFSRRQVMKPKVLDLNRLMANLEKLLRRLLGEDITLETHCAPDLGNIIADPGQIEQVIMNLCINARDAMPRGGRITVETSNVAMESTRRETRFAILQGDYVLLRIIDNGSGMDAETRSHLFEPFFTTKEVGKGTGLGLSTVYGIVKQTGGYIGVESAPGAGTSFDIYFPRSTAGAEAIETAGIPRDVRGGSESIMVVEDETMIRALVKNVLSSHGYTVFEADDGEHAEILFRAQKTSIDLIITDVVLPGLSGRDLVERLAATHPGTPALFMSGYTRDVIDNHGILHAGLAFLQKPFTPESLLLKVREVLDAVPHV